MAISCGNPARLLATIRSLYPDTIIETPDAIGTNKVLFPDNFIVNIFANGTVNFQGKESSTRSMIENIISTINAS